MAARPSGDDQLEVGRSEVSGAGSCSVASFSSANRPASMRLASVDLLRRGEQLRPADAVEVGPDQVGGDPALVLDHARRLVELEVGVGVLDLDVELPPSPFTASTFTGHRSSPLDLASSTWLDCTLLPAYPC